MDSSVQATPEWKDAVNARNDAQANYDAASKAAIQSLHSSPAYRAAVAGKLEVEKRREALKHDSDTTVEQRIEVATEALAASSAVSKLERGAGAGDPAVAEARNALVAANAKLAVLRQGVEANYKDDKEVQAAAKLVEDGKNALAQAKKDLAAQQAQAVAAQNSGGGGGGHGGGGGRKR